jgi:hypothetical protein
MRCRQLTWCNCAVIVWVAARRLEEVGVMEGDAMRLGNSEVREQEREEVLAELRYCPMVLGSNPLECTLLKARWVIKWLFLSN